MENSTGFMYVRAGGDSCASCFPSCADHRDGQAHERVVKKKKKGTIDKRVYLNRTEYMIFIGTINDNTRFISLLNVLVT